MDCSPPGSSVHGILQVRNLEWVAIPFSSELHMPYPNSLWGGSYSSSLKHGQLEAQKGKIIFKVTQGVTEPDFESRSMGGRGPLALDLWCWARPLELECKSLKSTAEEDSAVEVVPPAWHTRSWMCWWASFLPTMYISFLSCSLQDYSGSHTASPAGLWAAPERAES